MAFMFFTVSLLDGSQAEAELNAFLRSHKILAVDRRWVEQGSLSFWTFCVDFLERSSAATVPVERGGSPRTKVDYKETLKPAEFAVFAKLREVRKQLAQNEAVPVYTIFTNEQLAQMVLSRVTDKAGLARIDGIGEARVEKYGTPMLECLTESWKKFDETNRPAA